jgi:hypothetical protein
MRSAQLRDFLSRFHFQLVKGWDEEDDIGACRWTVRHVDWAFGFNSLSGIESWIKNAVRKELAERNAVDRFRSMCLEADAPTLDAINAWMTTGRRDPCICAIREELEEMATSRPDLPYHWLQLARGILGEVWGKYPGHLVLRCRDAYRALDTHVLCALAPAETPGRARARL